VLLQRHGLPSCPARAAKPPDAGCGIAAAGAVMVVPSVFRSWRVGCAAEVVVAGGCGDDDLVWSAVEAAIDELDLPAGHFADLLPRAQTPRPSR
jgi:hypothetical protein